VAVLLTIAGTVDAPGGAVSGAVEDEMGAEVSGTVREDAGVVGCGGGEGVITGCGDGPAEGGEVGMPVTAPVGVALGAVAICVVGGALVAGAGLDGGGVEGAGVPRPTICRKSTSATPVYAGAI
jgi:hypothetical protein